jgi:hypothetical protein
MFADPATRCQETVWHPVKPLSEIADGPNDVNHIRRGADWQMKIRDTRCKLKYLYSKIRV